MLTPHCSAASAMVAPPSIASTTRLRKSSEYGFAIHAGLLPVASLNHIRARMGIPDSAFSGNALEGYLVVQSQPTVSNIEAVTSLDLHTTASSMSLLSLDVYTSGILGEESLSILLDDEDNILQVTYRFINSLRIRDGRRVDPVTCRFDHVF